MNRKNYLRIIYWWYSTAVGHIKDQMGLTILDHGAVYAIPWDEIYHFNKCARRNIPFSAFLSYRSYYIIFLHPQVFYHPPLTKLQLWLLLAPGLLENPQLIGGFLVVNVVLLSQGLSSVDSPSFLKDIFCRNSQNV